MSSPRLKSTPSKDIQKYFSPTAFALNTALKEPGIKSAHFAAAFDHAYKHTPTLFKHTAADSKEASHNNMTFTYSKSCDNPDHEENYLFALRVRNFGKNPTDAKDVIAKLKEKCSDNNNERPAILVLQNGFLSEEAAKQLADEFIQTKDTSPDDAISSLILGDDLVVGSSNAEKHILRIKEANIRVAYEVPVNMKIGKGFST